MPKKPAGAKKVVTSSGAKASSANSLFKKSPRNFRIGGDIQPVKDLTRFVRWPKYIRIQRQKRIMMLRLKAPPAIGQFTQTIDKNTFGALSKLLKKYQPETNAEKKTRLQREAETRDKGKNEHVGPKPNHIKFGLNHVTNLVEEGKAKLVAMASDCEPIELLCFLPALCRSKNVPFCFVKSKSALGKFCHMKTATCVALTNVNKEDLSDFNTLQGRFMSEFNNNTDLRKRWTGGIMGIKNQHMMAKREKIREIELAKKQQM